MPEYILTERHGQRAELVLNRPDKRNALIVPMIDEMREAIEAFSADDGVSVVLIRGAGGTTAPASTRSRATSTPLRIVTR